ncbi:unnamed protein product [Closterium sp. NIES-53]
MREWFAQRTRLRSGATGAGDSFAGDTRVGGVGATRLGGAGVTAGAVGTGGAAAAGLGGARTRGTGAVGTGSVGGAGAGGAGAGDPTEPRGVGARGAGARGTGACGAGIGGAGPRDTGAVGDGAGGTGAGGGGARGARAGDTGAVDPRAGGAGAGGAVSGSIGAGGTVRPRPYFVPLLRQVLNSFTEHCGPESRPASPVCAVRTGRRVPRPRPPPVPGTHAMALRPSSVQLHVLLPPPPDSSLPAVPDLEFEFARAASPAISPLLATVVTDPSFESTAASALVAELVYFAAACRLDYTTTLVAESESASPPSVGGECALGTNVLEVRQEDFECLAAAVPHLVAMVLAPEGDPDAQDIPTTRSYAEAITGPYSSHWQTAMDAEMASWNSTGTYVDAVPPSGANIIDGMWILRVKQPPGSPPAFKARYVARCFIQRQGVDYFQTFSPTLKMTSLQVLLHIAAQRDYELHSLDFITTFLQCSLHEEIWLRHPPGFTESFPAGTKWSLRRPVYSLSPPSDESVEPSGPYPELVGCLLYLMTCTRPDLAYPLSILACYVATGRHRPEHWEAAKRVLRYLCSTLGMGLVLGGRGPFVLTSHADTSWVDDLATQRSSQVYTFSLGSGSVSWRSIRLSLVLSSSCEAKIYAGAMAAQELRWLTYLLTDLGEQPRSPLQRGQLRLAYVATRANTADIFTKALQSGDHLHFSTV